MRAATSAMLIIIAMAFGIAVYLYPQMPGRMASHWNAMGEADGHMPKFWGLFLMPLVSAGLSLLFLAIPRIDPLKRNIEKFRKHYEALVVIILLFLFYVFLLTTLWNLGMRFNLGQLLFPALAGLFFYIGTILGKFKRNWFIGIRTPWTLSSDRVWGRTHRLGGKLFKACGLIALLGALFPGHGLVLVLAPILLSAGYLFVYSYLEYQKEAK
jgi:uncharacterized membrane protein